MNQCQIKLTKFLLSFAGKDRQFYVSVVEMEELHAGQVSIDYNFNMGVFAAHTVIYYHEGAQFHSYTHSVLLQGSYSTVEGKSYVVYS